MRFLLLLVQFTLWLALVPAQRLPSSSGNDLAVTKSIDERKLTSDCMRELDTCLGDLQTMEDTCVASWPQPEQPANNGLFGWFMDVLISIWEFFFPPQDDTRQRMLQDECADDLVECQNSIDNFECSPGDDEPSPLPTSQPVLQTIESESPSTTPSSEPSKRPVAPTDFPTSSPAEAPTGSPTSTKPSAKPTRGPTQHPSVPPTASPTSKPPIVTPSASPSEAPTVLPTGSPVESPTSSPVDSPTSSPVDSPTGSPVDSPTSSPVDSPTSSPVDSPTSSPVDSPTGSPVDSPTSSPVDSPTGSPVDSPTSSPVDSPTTTEPVEIPTAAPSMSSTTERPTRAPIHSPTSDPTRQPITSGPTEQPTVPTGNPTVVRTPSPTKQPTTAEPTFPQVDFEKIERQVTTFYAIGDVPYTDYQEKKLKQQMDELPATGDFVIHVGDIRANSGRECSIDEYTNVANILKRSPVPVFIVLGDNEWTDCPNRVAAFSYWQEVFSNFESRHWEHSFDIRHQSGHEENFSFIHKETLFIGLNMVGGNPENFWIKLFTDELNWTKFLVRSFVEKVSPRTGRIVLFAHAFPSAKHKDLFFEPLAKFIDEELNNETPFLYLHGDGHQWLQKPEFMDQSSFYEIMLRGGASQPPLKVMVEADGEQASIDKAFQYKRYY